MSANASKFLILCVLASVLVVQTKNAAQGADIEVLNWNWFPDSQLSTGEYLSARAVGEIRNTSTRDLGSLVVEVRFYDDHGNYIISGGGMISVRIFPPGATATFDAMAHYRANMKKASLHFRTFDGIPLTASQR